MRKLCGLTYVCIVAFRINLRLVARCQPIMLILPIMLSCSAQIFDLNIYAHVKDLCLKSDCSIRVYSLVSIKINVNYGDFSKSISTYKLKSLIILAKHSTEIIYAQSHAGITG